MHRLRNAILVPQPKGVNPPFRRRRYGKPLHVAETHGRYWILTGPEGRRWTFWELRSTADPAGRSQLLRLPEPSWALAEVASLQGAISSCILDVTTHTVYETSDAYGERIQHHGQEQQRRLSLRLWRTYPTKPYASEQLPLLAGVSVR